MRFMRTVVLLAPLTMTLWGAEYFHPVVEGSLFESKHLPVVFKNSGYLTIIGEVGKLQKVTITTADGTPLYETSSHKNYVLIPLKQFKPLSSFCVVTISGSSGSVSQRVILP